MSWSGDHDTEESASPFPVERRREAVKGFQIIQKNYLLNKPGCCWLDGRWIFRKEGG